MYRSPATNRIIYLILNVRIFSHRAPLTPLAVRYFYCIHMCICVSAVAASHKPKIAYILIIPYILHSQLFAKEKRKEEEKSADTRTRIGDSNRANANAISILFIGLIQFYFNKYNLNYF